MAADEKRLNETADKMATNIARGIVGVGKAVQGSKKAPIIDAVERAPHEAAKWALKKYRAYVKAKADRAAAERARKAAAKKKKVDEYQPPAQPGAEQAKTTKPEPKPGIVQTGRDTRSAIEKAMEERRKARDAN